MGIYQKKNVKVYFKSMSPMGDLAQARNFPESGEFSFYAHFKMAND